MRKKLYELPAGDTRQFVWISSGTAPTSIYAAIFTGSETLVSSASMTSSGNGHYYANVTLPLSLGMFSAQTGATVSGKPYKRYSIIKTVKSDTD
jgi:hypothetical protein